MSRLAKKNILVVEDEFIIAADLCDSLRDASAVVIGPAANVDDAMLLVKHCAIDAAILDMNLNGHWSDPIAEELKARQIPFVFTTGYGANGRAQKFGAAVIAKPYVWEEVEEGLTVALEAAANGAII